jgi:hypothetical protein
MDPQNLVSLAQLLVAGELSPEQFAQQMAGALDSSIAPAELSTATLDLDRHRRCGFPEVIFGQGKSTETLREIIQTLVDAGEDVLATRVARESAAALLATFPRGRYNELAHTLRVPPEKGSGTEGQGTESEASRSASSHSAIRIPQSEISAPWVAVITAGTSDLPVAEEARETLEWMGVRVTMLHDVGVAGPHRLPQKLPAFQDADAIVVVAGMEGALPSIVGGYVPCPVIAVPTSVGYGANFGGVSALLSMLNSCASNVAVVNIDAGFKAAYLAGLIATRCHQNATAHERK